MWPSAKEGKIALTAAQLAMLLEGSIGVCHSAAGHRSRQDRRPHGIPVALLFCYGLAMLDVDKSLPKNPDEL